MCGECSDLVLPQGPQGPQGVPGNGIDNIVWTSNSGGSPQYTQGTTDTYTITLDDGSTYTFGVYNGADGSNGSNGANGSGGVSVLDHRTSDGGVFLGGVYFPGYVAAQAVNNQIVTDGANNLQTTVPANTYQNVGDFLRIRLAAGVQDPNVAFKSSGAMKYSIYWDNTEIITVNVGTHAKNNLGSAGFEVEVDISMVDNALIPAGNLVVSARSKYYRASAFALVNALGGPINVGVAKGATLNEVLSNPHTITVKATNTLSDSSIIDLDEAAGAASYDAGYVISYEVVKYEKV